MGTRRKNWRKIIAAAVLIGMMLIPQATFAGMNTAATISCYFVRTDVDEAEAYMSATFLSPRKVVSKVTLEEAPAGSTNFTAVEGPYSRTEYNTAVISRLLYFELDEDCDYRVKFEVMDTLDGVEATVTEYAYLQDADE